MSGRRVDPLTSWLGADAHLDSCVSRKSHSSPSAQRKADSLRLSALASLKSLDFAARPATNLTDRCVELGPHAGSDAAALHVATQDVALKRSRTFCERHSNSIELIARIIFGLARHFFGPGVVGFAVGGATHDSDAHNRSWRLVGGKLLSDGLHEFFVAHVMLFID